MSEFDKILELRKLGDKSILALKQELKTFDVFLQELSKNAPDNDKKTVAELRSVTEQAFNLAKMGKADEAQELIHKFNNGRQGNK